MRKVYFIGAGYEVVKAVIVEAETSGEAIRRARELYEENGWTFSYEEIEAARCL